LIYSLLITSAAAAASPSVKSDPCKGTSTIEMAQCMDGKIERASLRLRIYRTRAINRFRDDEHDPATAKAIEDSGVAFEAYQQTYCGAVLQRWIEGTIRYAMHQSCRLGLIDDETHRVWQDFLGYIQDDATPLLPEPKPTE
jgi:hypothetical protein